MRRGRELKRGTLLNGTLAWILDALQVRTSRICKQGLHIIDVSRSFHDLIVTKSLECSTLVYKKWLGSLLDPSII